mmetsp:Transcript_88325/g.142919  ORF Transcript_88325/g.142919 Transcript_88325/m.142919 type:complete len:204 (+) Transcript_88325:1188-1799(+)
MHATQRFSLSSSTTRACSGRATAARCSCPLSRAFVPALALALALVLALVLALACSCSASVARSCSCSCSRSLSCSRTSSRFLSRSRSCSCSRSLSRALSLSHSCSSSLCRALAGPPLEAAGDWENSCVGVGSQGFPSGLSQRPSVARRSRVPLRVVSFSLYVPSLRERDGTSGRGNVSTNSDRGCDRVRVRLDWKAANLSSYP